MPRLIAVTAGALLLLGACTQETATVQRENVMAAIQKAEEAQEAALGRNDLDGAVAVFAEDGMLYVPGMPPAKGRDAIRAVNRRSLNDPAIGVVIDNSSRKWWIAKSGDLATTTYHYAWTHTDERSGKPVTEQVVAQTTWAKQSDGSWKNVMDINAVYPASAAHGD